MANFFTRLAERSLGLSPVVQPAIASRFSSRSALPDATNPLQPISPVPEQLLTPEPYTTIKPITAQVEPEISIETSVPNRSAILPSPTPTSPTSLESTLQPSILPELRAKQSISPAAHPIDPPPSVGEKASQVPLEPFRVLHQNERIPVENHPSLAIGHPNSETRSAPSAIPANSSNQQDALVPVPSIISQSPGTQIAALKVVRFYLLQVGFSQLYGQLFHPLSFLRLQSIENRYLQPFASALVESKSGQLCQLLLLLKRLRCVLAWQCRSMII
jgi:hypothetical protein